MAQYQGVIALSFKASQHGGRCCGARHIYNFPSYSEQAVDELKRLIGYELQQENPLSDCLLFECILTDSQIYRQWGSKLLEIGFKRVMRWRNPNTENMLNMFVYVREIPPRSGY